MTLSAIVRQHRQNNQLSQRELATRLGCDHTYISKIENDATDYEPSERFLSDLADLLLVDSDWLIFQSGKIPDRYKPLLGSLALKYGDRLPTLLTELLNRKEDPDSDVS